MEKGYGIAAAEVGNLASGIVERNGFMIVF